MRPVARGSRPQDSQGRDVQFSEYAQARRDLISRMGEYCSYCEMHLDSSLAVEHVKPKQPPGAAAVDQARALDWDNFLLACTNCNSTKGNTEVDMSQYLWPDRDNTSRAFRYSEGGLVSPALTDDLEKKAINTMKLTGLDKYPTNDSKASDRRWENRREAWDIAQRSKKNLQNCNAPEMRDQIAISAKAQGYWSVWLAVFKDDPDMLERFIRVFPGTCADCFDVAAGYAPVARTGGEC